MKKKTFSMILALLLLLSVMNGFGAAAAEEAACRGEPGRAVEADLHSLALRPAGRVFRPLVRKERQQHLLDRVAIIMSVEIQLHVVFSRASLSPDRGLYSRERGAKNLLIYYIRPPGR